ncbi:MAG: hypothetical protein KDD58_07875 [Bdellovibrionales bacterium]|nr:hypothetical protein [Bdellovibrionales bacterium]
MGLRLFFKVFFLVFIFSLNSQANQSIYNKILSFDITHEIEWSKTKTILNGIYELEKDFVGGKIQLSKPLSDGRVTLTIDELVILVEKLLKSPEDFDNEKYSKREILNITFELVKRGVLFGAFNNSILTESFFQMLRGNELLSSLYDVRSQLGLANKLSTNLEKTLILASSFLSLASEANYKKLALEIQSQLRQILVSIYADLSEVKDASEAQKQFGVLILLTSYVIEQEFYNDNGKQVSEEKFKEKIEQLTGISSKDFESINRKFNVTIKKDPVLAILGGAMPAAIIVPITYVIGLGAMGIADATSGTSDFTNNYFLLTNWTSELLNNPFLIMAVIGLPAAAMGTIGGLYHYNVMQGPKKVVSRIVRLFKIRGQQLFKQCNQLLNGEELSKLFNN